MVTTEWSSTALPVKRPYAALTSSGIPSRCPNRYSGWAPKSMVTPPADCRGSKKRSGNHPRGLAALAVGQRFPYGPRVSRVEPGHRDDEGHSGLLDLRHHLPRRAKGGCDHL